MMIDVFDVLVQMKIYVLVSSKLKSRRRISMVHYRQPLDCQTVQLYTENTLY